MNGCVRTDSCISFLITSYLVDLCHTQRYVLVDKCLALMLKCDSMSQLRKFRKDRGFTLKSLAEVSEVHYVSLARLETGKFDPRLSTLRKLAKALKVTVCDLIDVQPLTKQKRRK